MSREYEAPGGEDSCHAGCGLGPVWRLPPSSRRWWAGGRQQLQQPCGWVLLVSLMLYTPGGWVLLASLYTRKKHTSANY